MVVPTMADVVVDVSVVLWSHALPVPVLAKKVDVSAPAAPAAPVVYAGRAVPALAVAPMTAAEFDVDVALTAALQPCGLPWRP